ncbi:MarC family protein [Coprobacter sp.]
MDNLLHFDIQEVISAFVVLFAVIDITGLVPIIIDLKQKGNDVNAGKAAFYSLFTFITFLFMGNMMLQLFHVDISSFAIAGSLVIFVMAIEMIFGVEIFKMDGPSGSATIVPIVFPLIAGAGSFTTLLSLRALYSLLDIIIALVLNIIIIYIVIKRVNLIERLLGKGGVYVLRKFFGIILLAISVRMFIDNLTKLLSTLL